MTAEELMTTIYELIDRNAISPQAEVKFKIIKHVTYINGEAETEDFDYSESDMYVDVYGSHMNTLILQED